MSTGTSPLRQAASTAFLYALPLVENANVRARLLGGGVPAGQFYLQPGLATPRDRFVTTPNADTIYANAFIDLRNGPATLTLPPVGERYASLALMDMFSNNFAVLSPRTIGRDGGSFTLVGPESAAPAGAIRSPTPWVWAMARVLVTGPDDADAARAVLGGFGCNAAPSTGGWAAGAERGAVWAEWLTSADALLLENPAPATDRRALAEMAPLGLGHAGFDPARFSPAEVAEIESGIADAKAQTRAAGFGGRVIGNWAYPAANTGNFFEDYLTRARIAVRGLAALPTAEATYLAALSPDGGLFDGEGPWRLRFDAGELPPVDGFWSLTMYQAEPTGALFLTGNALDRYTIGDRTPGLACGGDGSLEIVIARSDPGLPNWLPAPASGPFVPILRAYLPGESLVAQSYVPPAIDPLV